MALVPGAAADSLVDAVPTPSQAAPPSCEGNAGWKKQAAVGKIAEQIEDGELESMRMLSPPPSVVEAFDLMTDLPSAAEAGGEAANGALIIDFDPPVSGAINREACEPAQDMLVWQPQSQLPTIGLMWWDPSHSRELPCSTFGPEAVGESRRKALLSTSASSEPEVLCRVDRERLMQSTHGIRSGPRLVLVGEEDLPNLRLILAEEASLRPESQGTPGPVSPRRAQSIQSPARKHASHCNSPARARSSPSCNRAAAGTDSSPQRHCPPARTIHSSLQSASAHPSPSSRATPRVSRHRSKCSSRRSSPQTSHPRTSLPPRMPPWRSISPQRTLSPTRRHSTPRSSNSPRFVRSPRALGDLFVSPTDDTPCNRRAPLRCPSPQEEARPFFGRSQHRRSPTRRKSADDALAGLSDMLHKTLHKAMHGSTQDDVNGWIAQVPVGGGGKSLSSTGSINEMDFHATSLSFESMGSSASFSTSRETAVQTKQQVYVGWVPCSGVHFIKRQRMMDKAGALARTLGRPGHGTERIKFVGDMRKPQKSDRNISLNERAKKRQSPFRDFFDYLGLAGLYDDFSGRHDIAGYYVIMSLALMITLVGNEMFTLLDAHSQNDANTDRLAVVMLFIAGVFVIEIVCSCVFRDGFFGSFFFLLDIVAILSLVPEFLVLWDVTLLSSTSGTLQLARAGRTARSATRFARMGRISKALSYISHLKDMNSFHKDDEDSSGKQTSSAQRPNVKDRTDKTQLKVGKKLLDLMSYRVIVIIAVMMTFSILLDLVESDGIFRTSVPSSGEMNIITLSRLEGMLSISGGSIYAEPFRTNVVAFIADSNKAVGEESSCPESGLYGMIHARNTEGCELRFLRVLGTTVWGSLDDVRDPMIFKKHAHVLWSLDDECAPESALEEDGCIPDTCTFVSNKAEKFRDALRDLASVLMIAVVLGTSAALLGTDIDRLVIAPLETMLRMVKELSADPMAKLGRAELASQGEGETKMIAQAMVKLSAMLQIGFGAAGASIISRNLALSAGEGIQPLLLGHRMMGIFGFCDVRQFTFVTECLEEDVMIWINCIAEYLHTSVSDNGGAPNKNVGDAWLMAWPLDDGAWTASAPGMQTIAQDKAESALRALLRVIIETSCSHVLRRLTSNEQLLEKIPKYRTEMGFGLHVGWAIEGAIGSVHKVDPSYLSPHVEMSQKLEAGTKHYGVCILMTKDFYDLLPPKVQRLCRCVDRVMEPGLSMPVELYTYDFSSFGVDDGCMPLVTGTPARTFFDQFPPSTSPTFRALFAKGLRMYFDGDWISAIDVMRECLEARPEDRPSQQLLDVMRANDNIVPPAWKGHREISSSSWDIKRMESRPAARGSFRRSSFGSGWESRVGSSGSFQSSSRAGSPPSAPQAADTGTPSSAGAGGTPSPAAKGLSRTPAQAAFGPSLTSPAARGAMLCRRESMARSARGEVLSRAVAGALAKAGNEASCDEGPGRRWAGASIACPAIQPDRPCRARPSDPD